MTALKNQTPSEVLDVTGKTIPYPLYLTKKKVAELERGGRPEGVGRLIVSGERVYRLAGGQEVFGLGGAIGDRTGCGTRCARQHRTQGKRRQYGFAVPKKFHCSIPRGLRGRPAP